MKRALPSSLPFVLAAVLLIGADVWLIALTGLHATKAFYIAQSVLILSLVILLYLRNKFFRPLRTIATGMDLLREQDLNSRLSAVGQAEADRIVDMFNDMMERLKNERMRVREQNHFLDLLVEASPMGIIVLDWKQHIVSVNSAGARMLGADTAELMGQSLHDLPGALPEALAALRDHETRTLRLSNAIVMRCSRLTYMDRGYAHPFLLVERLTEEVMQAERSAYEKVIRMMAHEVNNSMAAVTSVLDTLAECSGDPMAAEALTACRQRCLRMSDFITAFANVVKIPEPELRETDLNVFLSESRTVLESLCAGRDISLEIVPAEGPVNVRLDSVLMEQVVINMVKNSVESIGRNGRIVLRVAAAPAGFTVEDNGGGISAETAGKLFSPFFTTKSNGRGLGLLFIREILKKHNCTFALHTDEDAITRFTVAFR